MEEQKQEGDIKTFGREAVGITATIASKQSVALEFAEIVAELVESVMFRGKLEGGKQLPGGSVWPSSRRRYCRCAVGPPAVE